ncbi:enolase C-terminal domain-like protein [Aspergillus saccharolyticus JOP 1030-1]|uniref:Enolase C-terminal domain-like protein n=1 Tax=Aspergillus saccharolyticus JOP 1030-1 TaxID=1450539 RepID=A0A318ZHR9_9EURO|nr:enolase C-terminal domain-like protein [Aspergillus saccharolyticus JOP 1030-1]PYH43240.1 enolase C-terminal domain-like protein [Aspergillus saccharolyticus JOP 1030-1]
MAVSVHPPFGYKLSIVRPGKRSSSDISSQMRLYQVNWILPRPSTLAICQVVGEDRNYGWGESILEGHAEAVEGTLNALCKRFQGYGADNIEHIGQISWRLGFYRERELARFSQGPRLDAVLDFHGCLHKPMAKQLAKALESHRPLFLEELSLSEHPEAIKQLADQVSNPIALGESLYSRWDVNCFLGDASVDILQPDIAHCGGISELRRIASMTETYDVAIAPHCPLGSNTLSACMQVDLATPNFVIPKMSLGVHYNTEPGKYHITSYVKDAGVFAVNDRYVDALTAPGLGIEVDEETVRQVAANAEPWLPKEFYGADGRIPEW